MRNLLSLIFLIFAGLSFTSCLNSDDSDSTSTSLGYFTLETSTKGSGLALVADNYDLVVYPASDYAKILMSNGQPLYERALLYFTYTNGDVTSSGTTTIVNNAAIVSGNQIPVSDLYLADNVPSTTLESDSIYDAASLNDFWASNGYLTTDIDCAYNVTSTDDAVLPTFTLYFDPKENTKDDEMNLRLVINRHDKSGYTTVSTQEFINSFDIRNFKSLVPGSGDISLTITIESNTPAKVISQTGTITRDSFTRSSNY